MVDVKEECSMVSGEEQITLQSQPVSSESMKACTGCYTTITPLWRGGPAGPKTLCNACGIKYHKKRRAQMGIESGKIEKAKSKKKMNSGNSIRNYSNQSNGEDKSSIRVPLKIKMVMKKCNGGGSEIIGRKLGEEEQAALLLMALSCGSIYA
ncbi:hypothetical protein V2J09_002240 [Rumex salicifolius]